MDANSIPFPTDPRFRNITGLRFGRLTATEYAGRSPGGLSLWVCRCDCGETRVVQLCNLQSGGSRSCGCAAEEMWNERVLQAPFLNNLKHWIVLGLAGKEPYTSVKRGFAYLWHVQCVNCAGRFTRTHTH